MNLSRRDFLRASSAAAALCAMGGCRSFCGKGALSVNGVKIGVQMWSVAELWKKDPVDAFRRLKALGYDGVQSIGFYSMNWDELEKMLDGEGLQIVDMPFFPKMLKDGDAKFLDFCKRFGVDFVFDPFEQCKSADEWRKLAGTLAEIGGRFAKHGIRVGYHNHQHEFREKYDGKSPFEMFYEAGLPFELDVGHVKLADNDPVEWLGKLKGRVPSIHAKPGGGNSVGGEGDKNDWPAIFAAARTAGVRWAVVECETRRDTYQDVEDTMNFLKKMA